MKGIINEWNSSEAFLVLQVARTKKSNDIIKESKNLTDLYIDPHKVTYSNCNVIDEFPT